MRTLARRVWHSGWTSLVLGLGLVLSSAIALAIGASDMPLWLHGVYVLGGIGAAIRGASRLGWLGPEAAANHRPAASARARWMEGGVLLLVVLVAFVLGSLQSG